MEGIVITTIFLGFFGFIAVSALIWAYRYFLRVCRPNEVLIFSGKDYRLADGSVRGYEVLAGGRRLFNPFFEKVERLDLTVMPVHISITGAYSRGGIPLTLQAVANVKIDSDERSIHNAVERFLGRGRNEIMRVAQETLEGNLRGVLATLTPEQVNENRLLFADQLAREAEPDLEKLGLHLDTLKIQNVADDRDYLDSIGRRRIAEILKVAEVAESNAVKTAEESEAEAQGRGEVARRNAQAQIQRVQNALRELQADLELRARSEEERATARAMTARAEAEQELQQVRTELEKLRLQADVVIPAEADKVARELTAAGEAAEIAERGRAMAEVLRMMTEVWVDAGDAAMDVFILQRMESVMKRVADAARQVEVREVALIDSGNGKALPNYVSSFPGIVSGLFKEMRETVGIDIEAVLTGGGGMTEGSGGGKSASAPASLGRRLSEARESGEGFSKRPTTQHSIPKLGEERDGPTEKA
ncbi:flotillin family protein [Lujinxingia vulgaris]|uniref:Flotillin family protein n=1 Tax=Lujinxingia vulgaris TaxID=2600176 RepID=A0A5C6XAU6_9DELT|nr:flotillin family protein [Lujinxingia vulgaris]TXD38456.1 flotillin family protein [Lujinxingia vulgaris]